MTGDGGRDARTVRRAVRAGLVVWLLIGGALVSLALGGGGDGAAVFVAVSAGFSVGAFTASGWLLVAALLDLLAGHRPGRRRAWWTVLVVLVAMASPTCVLGVSTAR